MSGFSVSSEPADGGPLRVGVAGLGMGANVLTLNGDPASPLVVTAVCARTEERLARFAEEHGVTRAYTDYDRMLDDPDVDVVAVYTPDALHAEHCVKALEAGKHVVCTKPMAVSNDEAERIVRAVGESGKKLMVAQTARFVPQHAHLKNLVSGGRLGRVMACRAQYIHDLNPFLSLTPWRLELPQDFMYGGGLHPIDLLRWYVGEVEEVFAYGLRGGRPPEYPIEDTFLLTLRFVSGCIGTVSVICGAVHPPVPIIQVDLFGDAGSATAAYTEGQPGHLRVVEEKISGQAVQETVYPPETGLTYRHGESEKRIFLHFADCVARDLEPEPGALESARGVAVGDAAWESVRTGRPARVRRDFGGMS